MKRSRGDVAAMAFAQLFRILLLGIFLCIAPRAFAADQVEVLWLGHATVRITSVAGKVIVIDPFLTKNPRTPVQYRDLKALGKVDLVLVTHGHGDHTLDLMDLVRLTGAKVIASYEFARNLVQLGLLQNDNTVPMNKGGMVEPLGRGIKIHMVPADHTSSVDFVALGLRPPTTKDLLHYSGGTAVGYVIELETGFKVYHSGDTAVFGDMALIHTFHKPDLAMVSIGGFFTMDPEGAAYAVRELIKPKKVMPIHFGTYPVLNRTPAEFKKALGDAPVEMLEVQPGQALKF